MTWPVLEQFAWPASQLLLAPFLLHRLGASQFGLWILALTFVFGAPVLSLGRSLSLLVLIPQQRSTASPTAWLLHRVLRQIGWVAPVVVLSATAVAWNWYGVVPVDRQTLALYAALTAGLVVATELDNAFALALKGYSRFRVGALCEVAGRAVQVVAFLLLIRQGDGVLTALSLSLACTAAKACLKAWALHRSREPAESVADAPPQPPALAREMTQLGLWNMLQVASGMIFFGYDRWLVGYVAGTAALGAYGICSQYVQFSHSIASAAGQPLIPWAARQLAANGQPVDARRLRRVFLLTALLSCVPVTLCWLLATPALSLWISPAFAAANGPLVDRLCIAFLLLALNIPISNLLMGMREARLVALAGLVAGLGLVAASQLWRPGGLAAVVDLKIGYAVFALVLAWPLLRRLRVSSRGAT